MMRFSSSAEVFRWIEGFINHERTGAAPRRPAIRDFRLERMEILARLAGNPEKYCPVIHVAGSKGKGSVTAMIARILEAGGIRTARYASPHVSDYRERISGGAAFFDEGIYTAAGEELRRVEAALWELPGEELRRFTGGEGGGGAPTFFELMTLYFFLCARMAGVQVMAVETGLGGRLDATNIVDPLVSVITLIEKEHTEYLGDTIAAIAGEKAGIIKPGRPVVLARQDEEALEVFRERAAERAAPLRYFPDEAEIRDLSVDREGTSFTLAPLRGPLKGDCWEPRGPVTGRFPQKPPLRGGRVPVPVEIQAENAGLAALALDTAFPDLGEEAIKVGLARFSLPGRFERLRSDPPYIVDGAHTPRSAENCVNTFRSLYGDGGILLFGCAADKDVPALAKILAPHFSMVIVTAPGTFKKSDPAAVYAAFKGTGSPGPGSRPRELLLIEKTAEAVQRSQDLGRERGLPVLGLGSFYLAGEIRAGFGLA